MSIKSPLRYPGGKTRAIKIISQFIPKNIKSIRSPFMGGGSVEIYYASNGIQVNAFDVFRPLVSYWICQLSSPIKLAEKIQNYYPLSKEKFYDLQKSFTDDNDILNQATKFFVLNRASFSGTTLSGGMSPNHPRFNQNSIDRVKKFNLTNLSVKELSFEYSIHNNIQEDFIFLDPPYLISSNLYGNKGNTHKGFNHEKLFQLLNLIDKPWLLCYNDCEEIRKLYKNYKIHTPEWKYGMGNNKKSKEILVENK